MRTHFLIVVMLVLSTAASSGQPSKLPHLPGLAARTMLFSTLRGVSMRDQEPRPWTGGPQLPARAAAGHFPPLVIPTRTTPTFDPRNLQGMLERTGTTPEQPTPLAPFDTVYERGYYGQRRYVYDRDMNGYPLQRTTQTNSMGRWDATEWTVCTYTSAGLLETQTTYDINYWGGIRDRSRCTYSPDGLKTSSMNEGFDPTTGEVICVSRDSMVYDHQGNRLYSEWENWVEREKAVGSKTVSWQSDSMYSHIEYYRAPGEWIPRERYTVHDDMQNRTSEALTEVWSCSQWINKSRSMSGGYSVNGEVNSLTWTWEDKEWVLASRVVFFNGGGISEYRIENRIGEDWIPESRQWYTEDDQGRTLHYALDVWQGGWRTAQSFTDVYGADGNLRRIDSSWTDGVLSEVHDITQDTTWRPFASRSEEWRDGVLSWGREVLYSYSASGQNTEVLSRTWRNGQWELADRYALIYSRNDLIVSITHCIDNAGTWEESYRSSSWDTTGCPVTWWALGGPSNGRWSTYFSEFSQLTFIYRTGPSDVARETGSIPEESTLHQNYPNPFNPATTIPFAVSTGTRTTVAIYDVLGREVGRPVDEWKDPGEYRVQFDASALASGMYICRFTAGPVNRTTKMVIVR